MNPLKHEIDPPAKPRSMPATEAPGFEAAPANLEPSFQAANRPADPESKIQTPVSAVQNLDWDMAAVQQEPRPADVSVERLVALLAYNGRRVGRDAVFALATLFTCLAGLALLDLTLSGTFAWVFLSIMALIASGTVMAQGIQIEQTKTALANSQLDNSHLGALCEALEWPEARVRNIARLLLTQQLPRLKQGDEKLLAIDQRNCLFRRLSLRAARKHPDLAVAILHTMPLIGNESALPYVARLAGASTFTEGEMRIKETALFELPELERRVAVQRAEEAARIAAESTQAAEREELLTQGEREQRAAVTAHVDAQVRAFEEEMRKIRQPGMRIEFLFASWGFIVPYTALQTWVHFADRDWPLGLLFGFLSVAGTQLYRLTLTNKHKAIANRLARMDDVRFIGRLLELLSWPDPDVCAGAMGALTRLLRRVKASDKVLRTPAQRAGLYRNITFANAHTHTDFLIAALKALEQIGDAAAMPYVVQLANAQPSSERERRVCDAAIACLPYLNQRARMTAGSHALLRASSATSTGADSLMRAASPSAATDSEQLLRANSGDGGA